LAEAFVAPPTVTEAARFVNAAGLAAQLAFVCVAAFVSPATVTVQLAVPEVIARPVTPESTRVPALYAAFAGPEQPAEYVRTGVALLIASPVGSVSPTLIPDCAGFEPLLARVKTSVVVAPSAMEAAPKVFATLGAMAFTTRHWSLEAFVATPVVTLAARFVNAAGLPTQLAFVCPAAFVTPATVTVQLTVPELIARPVSPESTRVPPVYTAVAGPEQPAEYATAGVALFSSNPAGSVSPTLIPDCAGFEPLLVSVKTSVVVAPSAIGLAPNVFATVGAPAVTTRQLLPTPLVRLAVPLMLAAPFVNATGRPAQLAFACAARFVTPLTVTVQLAVLALIVTAENAIESGAPCVTTLEPAHPAPKVTVGAPEVNFRLEGSASVNAIPACAGFEPLLVNVKTSVVDAVSAIVPAANAFVRVGCATVTTRHWFVETFVAPVAVTEAARFVNAAGLAAQLALVCAGAFVTPATVTVHEAVVAAIAIPVSPESTRVPPL
jgi:hypothetical protein